MNSHSRYPEITPNELAVKLKTSPGIVLLDVREPDEVRQARLDDPRVVYSPMSQLARRGPEALPEPACDRLAEIVVFCHQGARSLQVVLWLQQQGWSQVTSLSGGIDAYARLVDPSISRY